MEVCRSSRGLHSTSKSVKFALVQRCYVTSCYIYRFHFKLDTSLISNRALQKWSSFRIDVEIYFIKEILP